MSKLDIMKKLVAKGRTPLWYVKSLSEKRRIEVVLEGEGLGEKVQVVIGESFPTPPRYDEVFFQGIEQWEKEIEEKK